MIADLKPYAEYKESGLPWLGEVPERWSVQRTKWRFTHRKELNTDGDHTNVLSLTLRGVVNNNPDDPEGLVPKDYRTYQFFAKGDLVFKLIDLENLRTSRVGLVHEDGIMSSAYVRLVPSSPTNMRYFFHQFYDLYSRGIYNQLGAGVRSTLGPTDLLNVGIAIPPPDEQAAIVRFLDWANGRLERAIRAKRKVIALLGEQKQAIIHRAVTRGLDPSVPLKPSGIPWLGDIPQNWQLLALKRACRLSSLYGANVPADRYVQSGVRFLRTTDISDAGALRGQGVQISEDDARSYLMDDGDFLVSRSGTVGRAFVYRAAAHGPCGYAGYLVRFVLRQEVLLPEFLWFFTKTPAFSGFLRSVAIASTIENVNGEKFGNMPCVFPGVGEQLSILAWIATQTMPLDTAISRLYREIDLLREYRTRLVADLVTGKLDVREVAARLPDETAPDTVEEDTNLSLEPEAADEEAVV